jgi:thymidylate synthase ThyX
VSYEAKIIADSISPTGIRLTTLQVTFPRFLLAEFNTHRAFSRNSASSRAIPVKKRIQQVMADPFIPEQFGRNQKGMQAHHNLEGESVTTARGIWMGSLNVAVLEAQHLDEIGVHKQLANRLLEPFSWHTVVVTATDWDNFFHLRCHPDAQPEFQKIAGMMRDVMEASIPRLILMREWHLPYIRNEDWAETEPLMDSTWTQGGLLARISSARCARTSYLTHEGVRNVDADLALVNSKLLPSGHMSPFEHPATPMDTATEYYGNFKGWMQYRKLIPGESDPLGTHHD